MSRHRMRIAAWYIAFAIVAGAVNLIAQWLVIRITTTFDIEHGTSVAMALAVGTGVGLLTKYVLDKRFIFQDHTHGVIAHARRLSLYTTMGLLTTVIFWVTELLFTALSHSEIMMYCGGCVGLSIGYLIKYHLDKRFVFISTVPNNGMDPLTASPRFSTKSTGVDL